MTNATEMTVATVAAVNVFASIASVTTYAEAKRPSFKMALMAGKSEDVCKMILKMAEEQVDALTKEAGEDEDKLKEVPTVEKVVKAMFKSIAGSAKQVQEIMAKQALEKEEAERKAKEEAEKAEAEKAAAEQKAKEEAEEKIQKIVDSLMASGIADEKIARFHAESMVRDEMKKRNANAPAKYERAEVEYKGKVLSIPVRGNMNQEVKDALKETGLNREDFIKQYGKKDSTADAEQDAEQSESQTEEAQA